MNPPLVGCVSHLFDLAVQIYLAKYDLLLGQVNELMTQLRTTKNTGRLCKLTKLCAIKINKTRWSCIFSMVSKYLEIKDEIRQVYDVDEWVPPAADNRKLVRKLCGQ
ncbi:hypothetical protein P3T76_016371 [Phytophthora citrophthora]|uniref:Uncharacterized protein n=1 Tax=Phytophthora citrophthora TaxID=4793 RepID=A0AAD9L9I4_9STRA|nr:hypothetical protein P3T76_016371 [Phytophthora citrophthora]